MHRPVEARDRVRSRGKSKPQGLEQVYEKTAGRAAVLALRLPQTDC